MASTFESISHPFVILLGVPLALIGVVGGLFVTGTAVSVVVLIGLIVFPSSVVVNNAIVVDTINQRRAEGIEKREAIIGAAKLRLRPILITTLTTILGLMPLALGFGEGGEMQRPLALDHRRPRERDLADAGGHSGRLPDPHHETRAEPGVIRLLARLSVGRPVTVVMTFAAVLLLGGIMEPTSPSS